MAVGSKFQITRAVGYGTLTASSAASITLFQANYSYPNRIEDLREITIKNTGLAALQLLFTLDSWEAGTPDTNSADRLVSVILPVGEHIYLPNLRMLDFSTSAGGSSAYLLNNKAPSAINSGALYQVSGWTLGAALDDTDTTVTVNAGTHDFHIGDLIQVGTDLTTATRQEIMRVDSIDEETLTVTRALYGTSKADKDSQTDATEGAVSGARIHLPFFNITGNTNLYGGLSTAQTDGVGKFHIMNFFGYGRYTGAAAAGIVPGSISGKFYEAGFQEFGLSSINASTNSGLAASTEYGFDITVDGSGLLTSDYMKFTTDSSNVNFGGTNGVISKMQAALDEQYYTTSSTVLNERVIVSIVNGDIRFTSGQRLSTSAILLAAPSAGETTPFGVGRLPAIGSVEAPVAAKLPDDILLARGSTAQNKNTAAFFYDDGLGNIMGAATGSINYNTGEFSITGVPNANFVFSANYGTAHAGGTKISATGSKNSISSLQVRSLNTKIDGKVELTAIE